MPKKKYRITPSSSLPGYDSLWPSKYVPSIPGIQLGDEVGRDTAFRAEQAFVKQISSCTSKEEADQVRKQWEETRLNKPDGPRVLPFRLDDIKSLPGADLVGYMPRRVDLDIEWDNDAELILAEMEFSSADSPEDRALKIKVIEIYNSRLDEREKRKQFLVDRNLLDYKKNQIAEQQLPADERDLVNRMRLFARFHSGQEHEAFIQSLLKAKQLRKEIAKLQMYRRMGMRSMSEVEQWELDMKHRALLNTANKHAPADKMFAGTASRMDSNISDSTVDSSDRRLSRVDGSIAGSSRISGSYRDKSVVDLWKSSSSRSYRTSDRGDRASRQDSKAMEILLSKEEAKPASITENGINGADNPSYYGPSPMNVAASDNNVKLSSEAHPSGAERKLDASSVGIEDVAAKVEDKPIESNKTFHLTKPDDDEKKTNDSLESLLSSKEIELCKRLSLSPSHYIQVKTMLISESFKQGFHLPKADSSSGYNNPIVKIDIHKYGHIVDFCLHNGWIERR